ncbi:MAG: glycosyltransferase [Candidatus Pacebacteria bacterium]|jgi:polysaccharide biosynthesis protein PslH|nr:glycosyltransferase [Candidatus Paceibacterota bacterium]MBT4004775.1 glycosyltransferase [Candidatus Paceibacterota bacterium]MBT7184134.1 glycosyltransferase [Candidatus Paceibacterota bacterium]MBT7310034.1 glycosyltransferase [Candidatus Paceibacterota bacterium]
MKKIIYITEQFPYPPDSGGKIKTLNTLNTLSKKYQVHLISFSPQQIKIENENYLKRILTSSTVIVDKTINDHVKDNKNKLIRNYLKGVPYLIFQYQNQEATQKINKLIKKINPTAIHIDHLNMSQYLPAIKKCAWVFEEHNLESKLLWSRFICTKHLKTKLFLLIETFLTKFYELKILSKFDVIFSISDHDKKILKKITPPTPVFTYLLPIEKKSLSNKVEPGNILFIGDLTWQPNYNAVKWFIKGVLPLIVSTHPKITLHLVGKFDETLANYHGYSNTIFHGYQKNIQKFLKKADLFVMPFKIGEGIRIKTLIALSAGIPIVATSTGVKGLKLKPEHHFLLANNSLEFSRKISTLLTNKKLKAKLINNGYKYLLEQHSRKNNQQFLERYQKITREF